VLVAVVATTAFGRMYVGAHLPLDLVGGAGFGLVVSAITGSVVDRSEVDQPGVRRLEAARTEVEVP
jgi:membrane-associated phospholipid phosphatase